MTATTTKTLTGTMTTRTTTTLRMTRTTEILTATKRTTRAGLKPGIQSED